eukprot:4064846-Amphidinium_carterae.1
MKSCASRCIVCTPSANALIVHGVDRLCWPHLDYIKNRAQRMALEQPAGCVDPLCPFPPQVD